MLKRFLTTLSLVVAVLGLASGAQAQYMKIVTDNPTDNTKLRASGTTILTITLNTNHDKNGSLQTCNSHSAACGAPGTSQPLDMFGYTLDLIATGGTVTWGAFSAADVAYTDLQPAISNATEIEIVQFRPTGSFTSPGLVTIGTLPVTPANAATTSIGLQIGAGALDPFGFGTGFSTECDGFNFLNTYVLADGSDPCGVVSGLGPGDWFDWDGAGAAVAVNAQPVMTAPPTASGTEGVVLAAINASATDADVSNTLTITQSGKPADLTFTTNSPGVSPRTASITGTPGFTDAGVFNIIWTVNDGTGTGNATNSATTVLTIANTNRAPTLNQPVNMTVNENATADQVITGSDPDGDALTFSKTSGPTYLTVTTTNGTTGNIHLAPGFTDAGTAAATVRATDTGALFNEKSLTVTVNNTNRAPTLNQPANMTVNEGVTADQAITGSDPDGDALTFSLVSGPTYASVTTTNATTGNIHLAPGFSDAGTAAATARASDGSLTNDKSFTITVNNVNRAPTLNQPANMTVNEGATTDQVISGTDPDGDALTFSLVAGPAYVAVTTTNGTTGNIHLAPGFTDAGTAAATVRANDGNGGTNDKSLTITVNNTNRAPVLNQPANMTVNEGVTTDQTLTGTDPDGDALTFSLASGPTYASVTTANATTGNLHLAPGFSDAGTAAATVRASDGSLNNDKSLTITVNNVNRAPTLNQPANMTVNEGVTADQVITGTDPDGDALTFSKTSGPTYLTVTTTNGTTGNIHLAPGFSDAGTAAATVTATDTGALTNSKTLTVTVVNVNRAPTLNQPTNMTVNEGVTADQVITGTDPDGDALTFSLVSGPTYASVTTTNATTGNIHLAPGFSDAGTAAATARASDGSLTNDKSFTITVNNVDRPVSLNAIGDMTLIAGGTADQAFSASDPDGDAITFTSAGPVFLTRTDNAQVATTRTGNIHLAPSSVTSGTFSASVTATANATTSTRSFTITVTIVNNPPVLAQPANMTVNEGATADQTLNATDPDGNPLTFSKVAGPTYLTVTTTTPGTGTGTGNIHLAPGFSDAGTAAATVRASDGSLNSDKSLTVTVNNVNQAPVLAQPANMTVNEGVTADQVLNATDADAQALTFSLVSGPTYASVTTTTPGTGTATGNLHLAPGFSDAGTAAATVRASDGALNNDKSLTITVNNVNRAPTLNQPANMTVNEGVTADQVITGTDPDGDALTFSKTAGPTYLTVTTTNGTTGNIHLAPGFTDAGTAAATVRATDTGALFNEKSLTVTVVNVNRAPTLNQPANMSVAQGATSDQIISGTDPDGDALTFSKVSGPTFMTVTTTTSTTGNIHLAAGTLEPLGTSTATVRASDGSLTNDKSLTITVTPTNHAPTLNQPANMTVTEGATADQTLNATDPDGDPLTFSLVTGPTFASVTTTTPGTGTATGNLHVAPGFSDGNGAPPYPATVRVSDGSMTNDKSLTITVNDFNRAPVLNPIADMTVNEGATADQAISGTDPDGTPLTFTKSAGPTFLTVLTTTGTTGSIHLAPGFSDASVYGATVTASDGALTSSRSFTVTVNNVDRAPVLAAIANQTVAEGATADVAVSATDADGDVITLSATLPSFATLTSVPAAGTVNGSIHIAPNFGDAAGSPYSATVTASSGSPALTSTRNFTITVPGTNRPPVLVQPSDMTVDEGMTADQTLTASDPDGNPLTFTKDSGPLFLTVTTTSSTMGNAHLAPGFSDAGTYTAVVRATDPGSLFDQKSFGITVNNVNRAPVANTGGPYSGTVGVPVSFNGTGSSDPDGDALTYQWAFGDGSTGSGPTPTHAYLAAGVFTDSLAVTDNGSPALTSSTATSTVTISNELAATVFTSGTVRLGSGKPKQCFQIQPVGGDYANTDVVLSSIVAKYNTATVSSDPSKTTLDGDKNGDGISEIAACFTKASLRILFAGLPSGHNSVTIHISGTLTNGSAFGGDVTLDVVSNGSFTASTASVSPNPLNPKATLSFTMSKPGTVRIEMFDLQGRLVRTIVGPTYMTAGYHDVTIDGRGQSGEKLASGVYFIRGVTADGTFKNTITILK